MTISPSHITGISAVWARGLSIATALLTAFTFGLAVMAVPVAGRFCVVNCVDYPYTDILDQFPKNYLWMYPAMILCPVFVILLAVIYQASTPERKFFGLVGLCFGLMSSTILIFDYFVQISVVQPSLLLGETDGIALITMFNEHGIFIALEDIGYLLMAAAMGAAALVFTGLTLSEKVVRWTFLSAPVLCVSALVYVSFRYGIQRGYVFEVIAISIDWTALIVGSIALAVTFNAQSHKSSN